MNGCVWQGIIKKPVKLLNQTVAALGVTFRIVSSSTTNGLRVRIESDLDDAEIRSFEEQFLKLSDLSDPLVSRSVI